MEHIMILKISGIFTIIVILLIVSKVLGLLKYEEDFKYSITFSSFLAVLLFIIYIINQINSVYGVIPLY